MGLVSKIINSFYRRSNPPNWMSLRRTTPFEPDFGCNRGTPIDRYYIEQFLTANRHYIKGSILEIGDDVYTRKFGQAVEKSAVLHIDKTAAKATIIGDLAKPNELPAAIADCFICTQTLNFIFELDNAIAGIRRLLKSEGIALVTMAGLCQVSKYDYDRWGDYWRFTAQSARKLFEKHFDKNNIHVQTYGNAFAATCLVQGIVTEDVTTAELDVKDEVYQVVISVLVKNNSR
jgi:SAM-dependent methyltransferase